MIRNTRSKHRPKVRRQGRGVASSVKVIQIQNIDSSREQCKQHLPYNWKRYSEEMQKHTHIHCTSHYHQTLGETQRHWRARQGQTAWRQSGIPQPRTFTFPDLVIFVPSRQTQGLRGFPSVQKAFKAVPLNWGSSLDTGVGGVRGVLQCSDVLKGSQSRINYFSIPLRSNKSHIRIK